MTADYENIDMITLDEAEYHADIEAWERRHEGVAAQESPIHASPRDMAMALMARQTVYEVATTFADIQPGDIVRRTLIYPDGSTTTTEGVAKTLHTETVEDHEVSTWRSDYTMLAMSDDDVQDHIVLRRIPRERVLYSWS